MTEAGSVKGAIVAVKIGDTRLHCWPLGLVLFSWNAERVRLTEHEDPQKQRNTFANALFNLSGAPAVEYNTLHRHELSKCMRKRNVTR